MKISAISNVSSKKTTNNNKTANKNFGSVVPVNVVLDGKTIPNSFARYKIYQNVVRAFVCKINKKAKDGSLSELAQKYASFDSDFDTDTGIASSRAYGSKYDSVRYIVSGKQVDAIKELGCNIGVLKQDGSCLVAIDTREAEDILNATENRINENKGITIIANNDKGKINIEDFIIESHFYPNKFESYRPGYKRTVPLVDETDIPKNTPTASCLAPKPDQSKPPQVKSPKTTPYNNPNQLMFDFGE